MLGSTSVTSSYFTLANVAGSTGRVSSYCLVVAVLAKSRLAHKHMAHDTQAPKPRSALDQLETGFTDLSGGVVEST